MSTHRIPAGCALRLQSRISATVAGWFRAGTSAALLGALVLHGGIACAAEVRLQQGTAERLGVTTARAQPALILVLPDQPGMVRVPNAGLHVVTAPAEGVLTRMIVAEGSKIAAGDSLAELSGPGIATLEADYRNAHTAERVAESELARVQSLVADGVLPVRALENALSEHGRSVSLTRSSRAALDVAGTLPERIRALDAGALPAATLTLRAPAAGTVLRQYALPGERLPRSGLILELGDLRTLWVEAHVAVSRIRGFELGAQALVDAAPGVRIHGRVIAIGRRVHKADRGLLVRVEVEDPEGRLVPGQPVQVSIERAAPEGSLTIPRTALVMLEHQTHLFIRRDHHFQSVPITVLAEDAERLVIQGEVSAEDDVVVAGTSALKALVDTVVP